MTTYSALERMRADIQRCYRCGYCRDMVRDLTGTFHPCPVREHRRHEHFSARGRNTIARGIMEGRLEISYELRDLAYTCLSCDGCRDACSLIDWAKIDSPAINQAMRTELHLQGMTPESIRKVQQVKATRQSDCGKADKANCRVACPVGQEVPGYVGLVARGRPLEALELIRRDNPLPSICGRVCTHPCESACRQAETGEAISIQHLKRFCVDFERAAGGPAVKSQRKLDGPRIAVIGSGPAGLSAANRLARHGCPVTVFEKDEVIGGMMSTLIPDFKLSREDVLYDIERLRGQGVEIRTGVEIGVDQTLSGLLAEGFAAVVVCGGAWTSARLGIPGEDLRGVWGGFDFLRRAKSGEALTVGRRAVVVGGGKTALDAARTALRLGAKDVVIVYRRHRERAPFEQDDLLRALEEKVRFTDSVLPLEFVGRDGAVCAVKLRPQARGEMTQIEADTVIVAIGQKSDVAKTRIASELRLTEAGTIAVDGFRAAGALPIFAAGDVVSGPTSIVEAMASGRDAALAVMDALGVDRAAEPAHYPAWPVADLDPQRVGAPRCDTPRIALKSRRGGFAEVEKNFSRAQAVEEASRCLACDGERFAGLPLAQEAETLFFVGCNDYFRYPEVARSVVEVLARGGMQVAIADEEQCCGSPAYWSGEEALAEKLKRDNVAAFKRRGIKKIVTACADCYEMLGRHYGLDDQGIEVEHFAATLAGLIEAGKLKLKDHAAKVTYHDPCQLARKADVIAQPRAVLGAVAGLELVEMQRSKKGTQCCGGGPNRLVHLNDPELAAEIGKQRLLSEARDTGASAVVTACSWCRTQFEGLDGGGLPVYDLPYFVNHVVGVEANAIDVPPGPAVPA